MSNPASSARFRACGTSPALDDHAAGKVRLDDLIPGDGGFTQTAQDVRHPQVEGSLRRARIPTVRQRDFVAAEVGVRVGEDLREFAEERGHRAHGVRVIRVKAAGMHAKTIADGRYRLAETPFRMYREPA